MKNLIKSISNYSRDVTHDLELAFLVRPVVMFFVFLLVAFLELIQIALLPMLFLAIAVRDLLRPVRYFRQDWLLLVVRFSIGMLALPSLTAATILDIFFD